MDKQLAQLISDYQAAVGSAIFQMSNSDIEIPLSSNAWIDLKIPVHGELNGGIKYYKHGYGCKVYLPEGSIDFDFGQNGQIDGFDKWRLWDFCQRRSTVYTFDTQDALYKNVQQSVAAGHLFAGANNLYHVVDSVKLLGEEAARILTEGCSLPHKNVDSVHTLSSQCFYSAELMLKHYQVLDRLWTKEKKLSHSNTLKFRVYMFSWLGYLRETAEGFNKLSMRILIKNKRPECFLELIPKCNEIGRLEKKHADELRSLRNNIFHLRTDKEAIRSFFSDDGKRLEWARELHTAFTAFFSSYRELAEFHYLLSGRFGESEIRQESIERKKIKKSKTAAKLQA